MKFNKSIIKKVCLFVTSVLLIFSLILVLTTKNIIVSDPVFASHKELYSGSQKEIIGTEYDFTSDEISISDIKATTDLDNKIITISTAEELYQFSYKCYTNSSYLKYNYKLLCNIDYSSINNTFYPIGWLSSNTTSAFTGTFDGNGYDISNLKMLIINSTNESFYDSQEYFAMFAKNSGTIKNFGLIDNNISITSLITTISNSGIANICGENSGTIEHVYVKQLSETLNEGAGITALGGYRVAGICALNTGTIKDGYIAINSIFDINCTDIIEFADVCLINNGTINSFYFLNNAIDFSSSNFKFVEGGEFYFVFLSAANVKDKSGTNYPGILVKSISELNEKFSGNNSWSIKTTNTNKLSDYFTNDLPVGRTVKYSGNTVYIENTDDFVLMFNLFNANAYFATKALTYSIKADIDLSDIPANAITYTHAIDATITGQDYGKESSVVLVSGEKNSYPTIYNANIISSERTTTTLGIDAYGLFPYLTGTVENLNIYYDSISLSNIKKSSNVKGIGLVSGYLETATIKNVNTYVNSLTSTSSDKLSEYYFGGLVGITSEAHINNVTSGGNATIGTNSNYTKTSTLMQGIALGGLVGYLDDTRSDVYTSLSALNITLNCGASANYAVGGVIGAGYTNNVYELEYVGNINVGSSSNITYNSLYVSGIIGRLLGVNSELYSLVNQGTINVYANNNDTYVSGIINADIQTSSSASGSITASVYKRSDSVELFDISGIANRANINLLSSGTKTNYTSGINVNSSNGFISRINYLYNLSYNELYDKSKGTDKYQTKLGSQSIDISKVSSYSGLINNIGGKANFNMTLENVYNLRNIAFTTSDSITSDLKFALIALGEYINYNNLSNEGNLVFNVTNSVSQSNSKNYKLEVSGLIYELTESSTASNLYNGGNITFTENANSNVYLDLYISGVCLYNKASDSSESQNPLSQTFDKESIGSLDNAINNGDITVTSNGLVETDSATSGSNTTDVTSNTSQTSTKYFKGNVYISGITYLNKGVITNTFNLGDISILEFASTQSTYMASGIACILDTKYAMIKNSANNGTIKSISMSNEVTNTSYYYTYTSGIVCINNSNTSNIDEVIAFTINYGTILAFSGLANKERSTISSPYTYSGGILAYGALNIVNVLNYGNVYSSEVAGPIVGALDLNYDSNDFYLANTINYGNVNIFERYSTSGTTVSNATLSDVASLNTSFLDNQYGTYRTTKYYYAGAMFGLIDFVNGLKAKLTIRYVINFCQNQNICQADNQLNKTTIDTTTFITTRDANDTFGGSSIKYAPMSNVSDSAGNVGVFSQDFIFRKAINGDTSVIDYSTYQTDSYISDYYSFVNYDKVNTYLIEKIGWRTAAYLDAAEELAKNVSMMSTFVKNGSYNSSTSNLVEYTSTSWTDNIDSTVLENAITEIVKNGELSDKNSEIIKYFLFESSYTSSVYSSIRESIVSNILSYMDEDNVNYKDLIQKLLYDEVLAKVVSGEDANYTKVQTSINSVFSKISSSELREIITNYLDTISSDVIDPLFNDTTSSYYVKNIYNLVDTLLTGYSDDTISEMYKTILAASSSTTSDTLKFYDYLSSNTTQAKEIYKNIITNNSLSTNDSLLSILNTGLKKYETEFNTSNINDVYTSYSSSEYINGEIVTISKDYTELWNIVKNINSFKTYLTSTSGLFSTHTDPTSSIQYNSLIAKATEYNSTYQTQDAPSTKSSGVNSTSGLTIETSAKGNVYNRFIYTPDSIISDSTYYYGPFTAKGNLLSTDASFSTNSNYNSDIYNTSTITANKNFYTPFFMSLNETTRSNYINQANSQSTTKSIGTYYWNTAYSKGSSNNAASNQWVSDYIITNKPDDVKNFLQKNSSTGEYIIDGFDFENYSTYNNGSTIGNASTTEEHEALKSSYITGYGTSQVYSGIWYPVSIWYKDKSVVGVYLTAQTLSTQSAYEGSYVGVQTTEYTYYTIDDLVKLDGVRTRGKSSGNSDTDEINIVSAVMTKVLSEVEGKTVVLNALREYASNNDFTTSNYASLIYLASSLIGTDFASNITTNLISMESSDTLTNLSYSDTSSTTITNLYQKLEALVATQTYTDKQNLQFLASGNKDAFINLLKIVLTDYSDYDNDSGTEITNPDFTYYLYTYISYLKEQNSEITSSEIVKIINSVKETDLEYLAKLDDLTYSDFIDYFDQAAYDNASAAFGKSVNFEDVDTNIRDLASDTTYSDWYSGADNEGAYPKIGKVYPLNTESDKITATSNNIGYFTGSNNSLKTYSLTNNFKGTYTIYKSVKNDSKRSDEVINITGDIKTTLDDMLSSSNTNYHALNFSATIKADDFSKSNGITLSSKNTVGTPYIGGEDATGWVLPQSSLYFIPQIDGILKMVVYTDSSYTTAPGLYKITRSSKTENSKNNITVTQVTSASNSDSSVNYDSSMYTSLTAKTLYYIEIPVSAGTEYVLSRVDSGSSRSSYVLYLDLGQNESSYTIDYPDLSNIESNYNNYYNSGANISNFASTILAKDFITKIYDSTTLTSSVENISITSPSILLVKTNGVSGVSIKVNGTTTYNNSSGDAVTLSATVLNSYEGYRAFYISGSSDETYTVLTTDENISEVILVKQSDSFTISTTNGTTVKFNDTPILGGITNYTDLKEYKLNVDVSNKLLETLKLIYPTITTTNGTGKIYDIFNNTNFSESDIKNIISLLGTSDYSNSTTSVLAKLLDSLDSSHYNDLILNASEEAKKNIFKKMILLNGNGTYTQTDDNIIAAYIGNDYLTNSKNNSLKSSILYELLASYKDGKYQFITGDTTIDYDTFDSFVVHLGGSSNLDSYGIFALSSSLGKQNGTFIPDNIDLNSLDYNYKVEEDNFVLTTDPSSYWRDLTGNSTSSSYDLTNVNSVNYAIRYQMKQLKLSISTQIFESIITFGDYEIFASDSTIDTINGTITYYVPASYIEKLIQTSSATFTLDIASSASYIILSKDFTKYTKDGDNYILKDAILVTAEDQTVYTSYDIVLVPVSTKITSFRSDKTTIEYTGDTVVLTINSNLPDNYDLGSRLSVNNVYASESSANWHLDTSVKNNGITSNGLTSITILIDEAHIGGELSLKLNLYEDITNDTLTITKTKNQEALITKFEFEGTDLTSNFNNNALTSEILFGRAYNSDNFSDYTSDDFYLSDFTVSSNASVTITKSYSLSTNNLITYTITYTVVSEDLSTTNTYVHNLTEKSPYSNNETYANIYKDGNLVTSDGLYKLSFSYDNVSYNEAEEASLVYNSSNQKNYSVVMYNRGNNPEYRIKYLMNNIYTLGENVTYRLSSDTLNNNSSIIQTIGGFITSISDTTEPNIFKYEYIYTNTASWEGETYTRSYTFPQMLVIKGYSRDALLNRLTFLNSAISIGNTATAIKANNFNNTNAIVLSKDGTVCLDSGDVLYTNMFNNTNNAISVDGLTINYTQNSSDYSYTDYFAIGTVNDTDLSYFAPTFGIEEHAQIYQYTTLTKLSSYGTNQTVSDSTILSNHNDIYLYVPFNYTLKSGEIKTKVFLVKLDENYKWTSVYDPSDYTTALYTYSSSFNTIDATSTDDASFTYDSINYSVSSTAGSTNNNESLYMDYVGDPLSNHFWYVSYLVFSESSLHDDFTTGNIRYFHISIVDATNTIKFAVSLYAKNELKLDEVYMTISENIYKNNSFNSSRQISGYLIKGETDNYKNKVIDGETYFVYTLKFDLQLLPKGYFKFYLDLPSGFVATAKVDMKNQLDTTTSPGNNEEGTFLPYTSIIPKTINLEFNVNVGSYGSDIWGVKTSSLFTRLATLTE